MFQTIQGVAIIAVIACVFALIAFRSNTKRHYLHNTAKVVLLPAILVFAALFCIQQVPAGHVKVATLFGRVVPQPYTKVCIFQ